MKMSSFECQMIKLDNLVLEAAAAKTRLARQHQRRLEAINKKKSTPGTTPFEDDDLLSDNEPI